MSPDARIRQRCCLQDRPPVFHPPPPQVTKSNASPNFCRSLPCLMTSPPCHRGDNGDLSGGRFYHSFDGSYATSRCQEPRPSLTSSYDTGRYQEPRTSLTNSNGSYQEPRTTHGSYHDQQTSLAISRQQIHCPRYQEARPSLTNSHSSHDAGRYQEPRTSLLNCQPPPIPNCSPPGMVPPTFPNHQHAIAFPLIPLNYRSSDWVGESSKDYDGYPRQSYNTLRISKWVNPIPFDPDEGK